MKLRPSIAKTKTLLFTVFFLATVSHVFSQAINDRFITAATQGNLALVRQLLNQGANIEARDGIERQTALVFAAGRGHLDVVRFLIENRADINAQDARGWTALSEAGYFGRVEVVAFLLSQNASTLLSTSWHNANRHGNVLFWTVQSRFNTVPQKNQIVTLLLRYNTELEGRDDRDRDTIRIAEDNNYSYVLSLLRNFLARRERERLEYQLLAAIRQQNEARVQILLGNRNINPNLLLGNGESILNHAVSAQNVGIVRMLLEAGACPNFGNALGITPVMTAARLDNTALINLLIQRGANLNARDFNRRTVLFYAVENNNEAIIAMLVRTGISVNARDNRDNNALLHAAGKGNISVIAFLLNNGMNVNSRDRCGDTPLLIAAQKNNYQMFRLLASRGADPYIRNNSGYTALDFARRHENRQMLALFGGW
ncbi:MAG: ankyrin repeat domain-containing protein [Treponema sp.]|nr:ankyrin repeat domain-containing protein [Treponema sp.]